VNLLRLQLAAGGIIVLTLFG